MDYANSAEECSYFGKVFAWSPIDNLIDSGRVCNVAFLGADVAYTVCSVTFTVTDRSVDVTL